MLFLAGPIGVAWAYSKGKKMKKERLAAEAEATKQASMVTPIAPEKN